MDRRTYLKYSGLFASAIYLSPQLMVSCKQKGAVIPELYQKQPFRGLYLAKEAAIASKLNLSREVERLIEKKNPQKIYEFIKDNIQTIPADHHQCPSIRWGERGMLRCGKGTLFEKTSLLFRMLTEAGFNVKEVLIRKKLTPKDLNSIYCREVVREDESLDNQLTKIFDNVDLIEPIPYQVDNLNELSENLANTIEHSVPSDFFDKSDEPYFTEKDAYIIGVELTQDETIKVLHFAGEEQFKDFTNIPTSDISIYSKRCKELKDFKFELYIRYSNEQEKVKLLDHSFPIEDLIGRQLQLSFIPTLPFETLLNSDISKVNSFMPMVNLCLPGADEETIKKNSSLGTGFDIYGNQFKVNEKNEVVLNGFDLTIDNEDVSQIHSMSSKIDSSGFPRIEINLEVKDSNQVSLEGFGNVFSIKDNGREVMSYLIANRIRPKILVLWDGTGSVPYEYSVLTSERKTFLTNSFRINDIEPDITFLNHGVDLYKDVKNTNPSLFDHIIMVGDAGEMKEDDIAWYKEYIGSTPVSYHLIRSPRYHPEFTLSDNPASRAFGEENIYDFQTLEEDLFMLKESIKANGSYPIKLVYMATDESAEANHNVEISVLGNDNFVAHKNEYETSMYYERPYPCSLEVALDWGHGNLVKHLAGFNSKLDEEVTQDHYRQLREFCLGEHFILVEPELPLMPVLIEELNTGLLSRAPITQVTNIEELEKALDQTTDLPTLPYLCFHSIDNAIAENQLIYEDAYQSCFYSNYFDTQEEVLIEKIDILPTSRIKVISNKPETHYRHVLKTYASSAIREAEYFDTSTYAELKNKSLKVFDRAEKPYDPLTKWINSFSTYSSKLLIDAENERTSFWKIDNSGKLFAYLIDGTGGGAKKRHEENMKKAKKIAKIIKKIGKWLKVGKGFGIAMAYYLMLAKLYLIATYHITIMDSTGMMESILDVFTKGASSKVKAIKNKIS